MAAFCYFRRGLAGLQVSLIISFLAAASAGNFYQDFDITWGDGRAKILNNGELLTLSLDKASGSGFQSKNEYLFGKIAMQIKLVPGNSAGTVTAYYVSPPPLCPVLISWRLDVIFSSLCVNVWMVSVVFKRVGDSWWNRLWILGEPQWWSLHSSHQCVYPRPGKKREAILPLVRSNCWFPQLLHPLESTMRGVSRNRDTFSIFAFLLHDPNRSKSMYWLVFCPFQLLGWWHPHQGVQELGVSWCSLPKEPAHADILQFMECRWLGNKRRPCQD